VKNFCLVLIACISIIVVNLGLTHPGSGISTDGSGTVYFVDTGSGVWKLENDVLLTKLAGPAVHWLAYDKNNRLAGIDLPSFPRGGAKVSRTPEHLLLSSDFPVAIAQDGALLYPWQADDGRLTIFRLDPSGKTIEFAPVPKQRNGGDLLWINGITQGKDGSVYYTNNNTVTKVTQLGQTKHIYVE